MASKAKAEPKPKETVTLASLGLESFKMVEINRADLKGAEYNPRIITDAEKRKLRIGLKKHGLVAPITWNKTTGNIVGGHQRIEALDAIAGTQNYKLTVAQVEVDEVREKELNVLLNNAMAQGDWDMPKLKDILTDKRLDFDSMGFERSDMFRLFGDDVALDGDSHEKLDELAETVRKFSKMYNEIEARNQEKGREDFYLVVVFKDAQDRESYLKEVGLEDNRYQSGAEIRRLTQAAKSS